MGVSQEDGLPVLSCGKHNDPRDGACLMEYVSVLAGEKFTDRPVCADPLLAHLARMINDATSAPGRPALGRLAADIVGTSGADAQLHEELVLTCFATLRGQRAAPQPSRGRVRVLMRNRTARRYDMERAVRAIRSIPSRTQRDAALYELLAGAIAVCRRGRDADTAVGTLPVEEYGRSRNQSADPQR